MSSSSSGGWVVVVVAHCTVIAAQRLFGKVWHGHGIGPKQQVAYVCRKLHSVWCGSAELTIQMHQFHPTQWQVMHVSAPCV